MFESSVIQPKKCIAINRDPPRKPKYMGGIYNVHKLENNIILMPLLPK
jgi:hypothetical protein